MSSGLEVFRADIFREQGHVRRQFFQRLVFPSGARCGELLRVFRFVSAAFHSDEIEAVFPAKQVAVGSRAIARTWWNPSFSVAVIRTVENAIWQKGEPVN